MQQVYLGGGRSTEWREDFAKHFDGVLFGYDPFIHSRQGALYEFTHDDLAAVKDSALVIATVDYPRYTGLALEVGYARAKSIPVMLVWTLGERLDSMMAACSSWVFMDHASAFGYLEEKLKRDGGQIKP